MDPYVPDILPLESIDWGRHVSSIGKANAALARFDGMLQTIVNPDVLLSPLTTQEAVLSSRIEGTQATVEDVLTFEADPKMKIDAGMAADVQEIVNYRLAMRQAVDDLGKRPICLNMLRDLHATLMDSVRGVNKAPGEFRRVQNYIGPPGCTQETATFVPPSVDQLGKALDRWEKYVHYEEKDRLVQLAIVKAQFEVIHPFLDGNGRIGRMLIPLFLFEKDLLSSPMFYVSAYFEADRDLYYEKLQAITRDRDWDGWIEYFLNAILAQAETNTDRTRAIVDLNDRMRRDIPSLDRSQYGNQAVDALFAQPVFSAADFLTRSRIPKDTGLRILRTLKSLELVAEIRAARGRQPAVLIFAELLKITGDLPE